MAKTNLEDIYFDPADPGSFSSIKNLEKSARKHGITVNKGETKDFLASNIVYGLHYPARRRFPRRMVLADYPNQCWQADLCDMQAYSSANDGYNFILTSIDVFTKEADAIALKNKTANSVVAGLKSIFERRGSIPQMLQTDRGTEFSNAKVNKLCDEMGVNLFFSQNQDIKCSVVERFNRTLKQRMFKYQTATGSRRYIDVLDKLIEAYNNAHHRSINMTPMQAKSADYSQVFRNLYGYRNRRDMILNQEYREGKFKIGDTVRVKYDLSVLDRGYLPNWSDAWYTIVTVNHAQSIPRYIVKDERGRLQKRTYYDKELQLVDTSKARARIEKIIKINNKKKLALVHWLNTSSDLDSWIPLEEARRSILPSSGRS